MANMGLTVETWIKYGKLHKWGSYKVLNNKFRAFTHKKYWNITQYE